MKQAGDHKARLLISVAVTAGLRIWIFKLSSSCDLMLDSCGMRETMSQRCRAKKIE